MNCSYCQNEMQSGTSKIVPIAGGSSIILSFTSDEEAQKGFFKRKSIDKTILAFENIEAYYCNECKKIIFSIDAR